jgi:uncharacterized membrane protein YdfJ with MMPL/SSD domain
MRILTLTDQSTYIRAAIAEVGNTAFSGALWAILVLLLFLRNGYATLIIALAIPLSVLATFAPMRMMGVSLNIMSLGGLALGIGMLVDNAIVVLESIFKCREEGDNPRRAAIRGTAEVGSAVVASTMTTVAVFAPIAFIDGVAGQLFGDLALTVVLSPREAVELVLARCGIARRVIQWQQDGEQARLRMADAEHDAARQQHETKLRLQGLNAAVTYHQYYSHLGSVNFGHEWNASVGRKLAPGVNGLMKFADYTARGFGTDTKKFWLQLEFAY